MRQIKNSPQSLKERFPEAENDLSFLPSQTVLELGKKENKAFLPEVIPALKQKAPGRTLCQISDEVIDTKKELAKIAGALRSF